MTDFDDLYRELILDHYRRPRNKASLDHLPDTAVHENPSCGDSLKLEVRMDGEGGIEGIRFDGHGCAISMASTSMMTELLRGKSRGQALGIIDSVIDSLRGTAEENSLEKFGDLAALSGISRVPMRVKCAALPWNAVRKSLLP